MASFRHPDSSSGKPFFTKKAAVSNETAAFLMLITVNLMNKQRHTRRLQSQNQQAHNDAIIAKNLKTTLG
jgi:hypothetical protein